MYFEDLSKYNFFFKDSEEINIGWLDSGHDFEKKAPLQEFVEKLKAYKDHTTMQTRGWHQCPFCTDKATSSNEIRVVGKDGKIYASPTLVIHYVEKHNYSPPQEFVDAVLNGPEPGSDEYEEVLLGAKKRLSERILLERAKEKELKHIKKFD